MTVLRLEPQVDLFEVEPGMDLDSLRGQEFWDARFEHSKMEQTHYVKIIGTPKWSDEHGWVCLAQVDSMLCFISFRINVDTLEMRDA